LKNLYTYTAREYDSETGLYFYRARYYDPRAGRFLTKDPIGFAGGFNQYAYVENNPVNWVDPWGLWHCVPGANCNFTPAMRDALDCFDKCTRDNGGPCDNEITSGRRPGGGQHGSGNAADFNRANNPNLSRDVAARCREKCFPKGWGSEERNGPNSSDPNGTHFHYQLNTVPGGTPRFAPGIQPYQPSPPR
jgi:RHS repeat-associated protein